ncbi:hypothetical protein ARMGADRAFT_97641 [Armillaria gallica]|uniref:Uncharacterized protein n=1 Tax=Armillaria gallica TaxID=47427 RepID=A0A2H3CDE0_ARMGA|nr:hypothetical protein ARMGADRAFT_97641 [Armillaria gallica]
MLSSSPALGKTRHLDILVLSQIEGDTPTVTSTRPTRGGLMIELNFARGLSSVHVLGHGGVRDRGGNRRASSIAIHRPPNTPVADSHSEVELPRVSNS